MGFFCSSSPVTGPNTMRCAAPHRTHGWSQAAGGCNKPCEAELLLLLLPCDVVLQGCGRRKEKKKNGSLDLKGGRGACVSSHHRIAANSCRLRCWAGGVAQSGRGPPQTLAPISTMGPGI